MVTIIVNKEVVKGETISTAKGEELALHAPFPKLLSKLNGTIKINSKDHEVLTKKELKYLYDSKETLIVNNEYYTMKLEGKDIVNYGNKLYTNLSLEKDKNGFIFEMNKGENLPGKVEISLNGININELEYLYLFNEAKNKYERLNYSIDEEKLLIDISGKYLLSDRKLNRLGVNVYIVIIGVICLFAVMGGYIVVKKKHWFW